MSQAKKENVTICYNFTVNISVQQDKYSFQHLSRMLQIIANLALPEDCMTTI
jgi:hypothetical protein